MKRLLGVFCLIFLSLEGGACLAQNTAAKPDKQNVVVAQVGPYKLTQAEFAEMLKNAPAELKMLLAQQPALKQSLLRRWSEITLLAIGAREHGLEKTPAVKVRLQEAVNSILAQEYLTRMILKDIKPVNKQEAQTYYQHHRKEFVSPAAIHVRHILIAIPQKASQEQMKSAYQKALEIRKQILKGEDFAKLAQKYSADPTTRGKGGDLGFFSKGQLIKEFEQAAWALKPGEISPPVRTNLGYHIIQVEERRPARQKEFAEVAEQIQKQLLQQRQEKALEAALQRLEAKHPVHIYPERLD